MTTIVDKMRSHVHRIGNALAPLKNRRPIPGEMVGGPMIAIVAELTEALTELAAEVHELNGRVAALEEN